MADRELKKLNRRELLKMLLVQCEETERLQQESDEIREEYGMMMESYERLKKKLDIKDARLNQKDAKIAELKQQIEEMKQSKVIELEEAGSIAEAAIRINGVFEAAQRAAEQYLMNIRKLGESDTAKPQTRIRTHAPMEKKDENQIPFEPGKISGIRKKSGPARIRQVMPKETNRINRGYDQNPVMTGHNGDESVRIAAASGGVHG